MATKTISLDIAAYDALRRRKRSGQSFSDVIKEHFGPEATGESLLRTLEHVSLDESTLDELERIVAERCKSPARGADL